MNESAKQQLWVLLDEPLLPFNELDKAIVLSS